MAKFSTFEQQIIGKLDAIDLHGDYSASNWTKTIFKELGNLGKSKGYYVGAAGLQDEFDCGGWLYDMVWYKERNGVLDEVQLVLECEWDKKIQGIKYDLEKLLVARAAYRFMIFEASEQDIQELVDTLIGIIKNSSISQPGDRYVLSAVGSKEGDFEHRQYIHV